MNKDYNTLKTTTLYHRGEKMPVKVTKVDGYRVSTPHGTKAKHTTKGKAEAQKRLLNAVEHGWKPTGKKAVKSY